MADDDRMISTRVGVIVRSVLQVALVLTLPFCPTWVQVLGYLGFVLYIGAGLWAFFPRPCYVCGRWPGTVAVPRDGVWVFKPWWHPAPPTSGDMQWVCDRHWTMYLDDVVTRRIQ